MLNTVITQETLHTDVHIFICMASQQRLIAYSHKMDRHIYSSDGHKMTLRKHIFCNIYYHTSYIILY
jgi:hypothetical protein